MKIQKKLKKLTAALSAAAFAASAALPVYADIPAPGVSRIPKNSQIVGPDNTARDVSVELPAKFDLRDLDGRSYVTPVRNQGDTNNCWAFSCCAASETSILYELAHEQNVQIDPSQMVFSPLHLSWFSHNPLPADNEYYPAQGGEGGGYLTTDKITAPSTVQIGGLATIALSTFSKGMGPSYEYLDPYKNKSGKVVSYTGETVYAGINEEWSCDEDHRFFSAFELEDANVLPAPMNRPGTIGDKVLNLKANDVIKSELLKGRGVVIGIHNENPAVSPGADPEDEVYYMSNEYALYHYIYETANHNVCIVGWDDNYSKDHFLQGIDSDNYNRTPPTDGAWIVKNSYGALDREFPDHGDYGVNGSGYFYVSYYDMSIDEAVSFNFYTDDIYNENRDHIIDQHDLMLIMDLKGIKADTPQLMSNVFDVRQDEDLKAVSTHTIYSGTEVNYRVYKLHENAMAPTDGALMKEITVTYPYAGFHRTNFDQPIRFSRGDRYSIVVSQRAGNDYILPLNYTDSKKDARDQLDDGRYDGPYNSYVKRYAAGIINRGESYYATGTGEGGYEWVDWVDMIPDIRQTFPNSLLGPDYTDFDNPPIKGFADPVEEKPDDTKITIRFDTDGGTEIAPITQERGTAVTMPAFPTRPGYTFAGWDSEIPAFMPSGNMTIRAKWIVNQYTITFDTAGGTAIPPVTQDYGTVVIPPAAPTREGYVFTGWNMMIPATMPAMDITITAGWASTAPDPFIPSYVPPSTAAPITAATPAAPTADPAHDITKYTITGRQNEINASELKWDALPDASAYLLYIKADGRYVFVQDLDSVTDARIVLGSNGKYYVSSGSDYTVYKYNKKAAKFDRTGTLKADRIEKITKANNVTIDYMVKYTRNGKVSAEIDSYKVSVKIYYKPALRLTTGIDPSDGKSFIRLRWDRVEGAEAYRVYRYVNGKLRFVTELGPDRPTLKISGTKPGKTYTYAAKALVNGEWTKADSGDLASIGSK